MHKVVQFAPEIEPLVRFVEDTAPERIIEETVSKLRDGVSGKDLLAAAALAVTRSTDVSVGHHGGPTHPVCGIYPAYQTSQRLRGEWAYLPVVQSVALCNEHVHAPEMGPYLMAELQPVEAKDVATLIRKKYYRASEGTLEETRDNFLFMMQVKYPAAAEGHLLYLLERMPRDEVLDLIFTKAIPLNPHDDHYFLFPSYISRALDTVGWDLAKHLLRPVVRWQGRNPYRGDHPTFAVIKELVEEHQLFDRDLTRRSTSAETEVIGQLGREIGTCEDFSKIPGMVAEALAGGLSLEGTAESLSVGAGTMYLRSDYGNPMDAHLQTGINSRRYLLAKDGISLQNKVLALMTWNTGPEIILCQDKLEWEPEADRAVLDRLPDRSQEALLDSIEQSCYDYPVAADLGSFGLPKLRTSPDELRHSMALAQQYAEKGYDPMALFVRMGEVISKDDFTEMHSFKQHQAAVEEYYSTREPFRWVHLVGAVKFAAMTHGAKQSVFSEAREVLKV